VRDGDLIELNVTRAEANLLVDDSELSRRREAWKPQPPRYERGFGASTSHTLPRQIWDATSTLCTPELKHPNLRSLEPVNAMTN
jgi:dihydroxyacid dehydratase/phosphogluconate dehydratase